MSSEIIQNVVAYDNHDDFQHVKFIFSQNFISLFWGLFNDETDLRVRKYNNSMSALKYYVWVSYTTMPILVPHSKALIWYKGRVVCLFLTMIDCSHCGPKKEIFMTLPQKIQKP